MCSGRQRVPVLQTCLKCASWRACALKNRLNQLQAELARSTHPAQTEVQSDRHANMMTGTCTIWRARLGCCDSARVQARGRHHCTVPPPRAGASPSAFGPHAAAKHMRTATCRHQSHTWLIMSVGRGMEGGRRQNSKDNYSRAHSAAEDGKVVALMQLCS